MKKIGLFLVIILALTLILLSNGCGGPDTPDKPEPPAQSQPPTETPPPAPPPPESPTTSVNISPGIITFIPGYQLSIALNVNNVSNLYATAFELTFDPAVLKFIDAQKGNFLEQGSSINIFTKIDPPGHLIIGYSIAGSSNGISGNGTLMTITFKTLKAGNSDLIFQNNALCSTKTIFEEKCVVIPADWVGGLAIGG